MFVAIYRFEVHPDKLDEFRAAWLSVTKSIYERCGSLGSRLHRSGPATFIAYGQWPSRNSWAAMGTTAWTSGQQAVSREMHACLENTQTLHELEICDDFLQVSVFSE